ncbi:hypothetical protein [Cellvibrio sp.]|uniref:hypothetical protein n=1 Tax=Cellvibrio sp. TaxID=1965322 RepID=UPI00396482C0
MGQLTFITAHASLRHLPLILTKITIVLVILGTSLQLIKFIGGHGRLFGLVPLLNLNGEHNIPSFFSAFLLSLAAYILGLTYRLMRKSNQALYWLVLTVGFGFMAVDEAVSLHERLVQPIRDLLGRDQHFGVLYFAWIIPALFIVMVVGLCFVGFLKRLDKSTRNAFMVSALLYLGGAIGMEMVGGWYDEIHGPENLGYVLCFTIEETLEMAGVIYFIRALLCYLETQVKVIT